MGTPHKPNTRRKPATVAATPSTTSEGAPASRKIHAAEHTEQPASAERSLHGDSPRDSAQPTPSAKEALKSLDSKAFTDDSLTTSKIQMNEQDTRDNKLHTDPSTIDFLVLMQGREFIQQAVRSTGHIKSLTHARERNHTPTNLQAPSNIRLYQPRIQTTLQIKSLQSKFEKDLVDLLITHHTRTQLLARDEFETIFNQLGQTAHPHRILIKWLTYIKDLNRPRQYRPALVPPSDQQSRDTEKRQPTKRTTPEPASKRPARKRSPSPTPTLASLFK